ncbi:unnamed protein product [Xylocopa violacea]|uniref:ABC transporter domain-containing protein n=1 Tax=Xylocopa violacea TaxID=135666 RepID=A0ABP1NK06_XYLVO
MYHRVVLLALPRAQAIDINFNDIRYEVKSGLRGPKKQVLKGVSGTFKSGELTAIMGPSGAGKSTLLNILTGFEQNHWKGQIEYVGENGEHTWNEYRKQSCYIQQDDNLHPLFTVSEIMWMATNLKIGSLSRKAKAMLIDDVLENLDLIKTKNTACSNLSGGQKKRLSIALELVDNPPVMFLDEPTTGLDSLSSYQCISLLKSLAKAGRTIVCTIHQPSAILYEMFDNVYLLAQGMCMYEGATINTISYFASIGLHCPKYHNPADFMIEVVSNEYGNFTDHLVSLASNKEKCWRLDTPQSTKEESSDCNNQTKATVLIQAPSEFNRFFVLMNRCMTQVFRDWTMIHLKIIMHLLVGVLLGLLFSGCSQDGSKAISNVGFMVVGCVYLAYTSMMPAVLKLPSEFPTLRKERFNNWYQLRTYYIALLITTIPLQVVFALAYSSPAYFLSHQPTEVNRFLMYSFVFTLVALLAESFGFLIGTVLNDPVNGTFCGAILTSSLLLLSGFFALLKYTPTILYYVSYLSYFRHSLHALVHVIYGFGREKIPCPRIYCHYRLPEVLMTEFSMMDGKYWVDILVIFCNYLFFRTIAYWMLKRKLSTV